MSSTEQTKKRFPGLSLKNSVTLATVLGLALVLLIAGIVGNIMLSSEINTVMDQQLEKRAIARLALLDHKDDGRISVSLLDDTQLDGKTWVFIDGQPLLESDASDSVEASVKQLSRSRRTVYRTVGDGDARLIATPVTDSRGTRRGTMVVAISRAAYHSSERVARLAALLLGFFALLAAAVAVRWSTGRALRPVDEMTAKVARWSDESRGERFDLGEPYDEITQLAATLDGLLERVDEALLRERRLTVEIAHELRSPLAGIRAGAELLRADASGTVRDQTDQIIASADRATRAIATLLSTHAHGDGPTPWCEPHQVLADLIKVSEPAAAERGVTVELEPASSQFEVRVAPDVLAQTLSPLLENMVLHARSLVRPSVRVEGPQLIVHIQDDGAGFGGLDLDEIFETGISAAGSTGLGLPLSRRLAETFGGELRAVRTEVGGAFELIIPGVRVS